MLIAVISDTHLPRGRRRLPDECREHLREAELVVHAGDVSTAAVLEELSAIGPPLVAVHGNIDEPALVRRLPAQLELELAGVRLAVTHDAGPAKGRLRRLRKRFPRADAVVFGHSHIPLLDVEEGFQIFNPGSPTDRRRQPRHTMGMARIEDRALSFEHVALEG
jgi:putative phosphoesterase